MKLIRKFCCIQLPHGETIKHNHHGKNKTFLTDRITLIQSLPGISVVVMATDSADACVLVERRVLALSSAKPTTKVQIPSAVVKKIHKKSSLS